MPLRSQLIRLAHERADLRPHLLPILAESVVAKRNELDVGDRVQEITPFGRPVPDHEGDVEAVPHGWGPWRDERVVVRWDDGRRERVDPALVHEVEDVGDRARRVASRHLQGYVSLPDDAFSFGFEGPGADPKGKMLATAVRDAAGEIRGQAKALWRSLAARLLQCADVDVQPKVSRVYIGLTLRDLYEEVGRDALTYFESIPKR